MNIRSAIVVNGRANERRPSLQRFLIEPGPEAHGSLRAVAERIVSPRSYLSPLAAPATELYRELPPRTGRPARRRIQPYVNLRLFLSVIRKEFLFFFLN